MSGGDIERGRWGGLVENRSLERGREKERMKEGAGKVEEGRRKGRGRRMRKKERMRKEEGKVEEGKREG